MQKASVAGLKNFNKGKETIIDCPINQRELNLQLNEIFNQHHYKEGLVKKNAVYLDVGACIGLASVYFYDWAKKIYAIEPSSHAFTALKNNMKNYPKVECFNNAISVFDRQEYLYALKGGNIGQTMLPKSKEVIAGKEPVNSMSLETFFKKNKIKHIDVMKIDVEGSEYMILSHPTFSKVADKIDYIIGEAHYMPFAQPHFIPEILKEYGFETVFPEDKNNYYSMMSVNFPDHPPKEYKVTCNTIFVAKRKK